MAGNLGAMATDYPVTMAVRVGCKSVAPCAPEVAGRHSGYQVGGTSPFGMKRAMTIYCEKSVGELPRIYINGGARGFLVGWTRASCIAC